MNRSELIQHIRKILSFVLIGIMIVSILLSTVIALQIWSDLYSGGAGAFNPPPEANALTFLNSYPNLTSMPIYTFPNSLQTVEFSDSPSFNSGPVSSFWSSKSPEEALWAYTYPIDRAPYTEPIIFVDGNKDPLASYQSDYVLSTMLNTSNVLYSEGGISIYSTPKLSTPVPSSNTVFMLQPSALNGTLDSVSKDTYLLLSYMDLNYTSGIIGQYVALNKTLILFDTSASLSIISQLKPQRIVILNAMGFGPFSNLFFDGKKSYYNLTQSYSGISNGQFETALPHPLDSAQLVVRNTSRVVSWYLGENGTTPFVVDGTVKGLPATYINIMPIIRSSDLQSTVLESMFRFIGLDLTRADSNNLDYIPSNYFTFSSLDASGQVTVNSSSIMLTGDLHLEEISNGSSLLFNISSITLFGSPDAVVASSGLESKQGLGFYSVFEETAPASIVHFSTMKILEKNGTTVIRPFVAGINFTVTGEQTLTVRTPELMIHGVANFGGASGGSPFWRMNGGSVAFRGTVSADLLLSDEFYVAAASLAGVVSNSAVANQNELYLQSILQSLPIFIVVSAIFLWGKRLFGNNGILSKSNRGLLLKKHALSIFLASIIIVASLSTTIYLGLYFNFFPTHSSMFEYHGHLSARLDFITPQPVSNNSVEIIFGVSETGGQAPFNFSARWSDGVNQSNDVGVFARSFPSASIIPSFVEVIVRSSDGQTDSILVVVPNVNRSVTSTSNQTVVTSTNTTSSSILPKMIFSESGLPTGTMWSVSVNGTNEESATNSIVFDLPSGTYTYSIAEPYDGMNFSRAYIPSPQNGTVFLDRNSVKTTISYSVLFIGIPMEYIIALNGTSTHLANGSEEFAVSYYNYFPVQIQALISVVLINHTTGFVQEVAMAAPSHHIETVYLVANGLRAGAYSVSISAETPDGIRISQYLNSTILI